MRQSRVDFISAIVVILVGLFFLILARQIKTSGFQTAAEALVGPPMVPLTIASLIIGLGVLELVAIILRHRNNAGEAEKDLADSAASEFSELSIQVIAKLAATLAIGIAYVWLLSATGYLISTAITLAALLALFGTRSVVKVTIIAVVGAAIYYFLFIRLMGIYSPVGWLVNFG